MLRTGFMWPHHAGTAVRIYIYERKTNSEAAEFKEWVMMGVLLCASCSISSIVLNSREWY